MRGKSHKAPRFDSGICNFDEAELDQRNDPQKLKSDEENPFEVVKENPSE